MCLHPISIPNPNYGNKSPLIKQIKDTTSQRIMVPCGTCPECIRLRQMYFVQRVQMESLDNHLFFCTITYNNDSIPVVSTSTGYDIRFSDVADVQKMFKRLRKSNAFGRPFRHFSVSELGGKNSRPHFHILFMLPKYPSDTLHDCMNLEKVLFEAVKSEWRRNYGSTRSPVYRPCCDFIRYFSRGRWRGTYDLTFVNPVTAGGSCTRVAFYVVKYMLKPSRRATRLQQALHLNLPEDEYNDIWSMVKPRHFESEAFGLGQGLVDGKPKPTPQVYAYLRKCIDLSKHGPNPFPKFFLLESGKSFPLCRYYKHNPDIFTLSDFWDFFFSSHEREDNMIITESPNLPQLWQKIADFKEQVSLVDYHATSSEFDDLFDDNSNLNLLDF